MIWRLYEVEDPAWPLDDAARRDLRLAEAVPMTTKSRPWQTASGRSPRGYLVIPDAYRI